MALFGESCPCDSGEKYKKCCGVFLSDEGYPDRPEVLMRSRYAAYVKGNFPYLIKTLHPQKRKDYDEEAMKAWSKESDWLGLEVLSSELEGSKGKVEFKANYKIRGEKKCHHEKAEFRKSGDKWFFYDGRQVGQPAQTRENPKVGRNDPCACGSGKKFKKCCGT